jgi:NitT/TauT family transport system permease protein
MRRRCARRGIPGCFGRRNNLVERGMALLLEAPPAPVTLERNKAGALPRLGRSVGLPLGFAIVATIAWEILCRVTRISPELLPPPSAVWRVLSENYEILLQQALPTTIESIVSFWLASLFGVALGVAITFSAWVREALYPNIVMFQLIPKIALAPLFIVWLGVGSDSCIVVAMFIAFFPVVVSTATGLVSAKPEVLLLCRSLTASEWQMFRLARFPYAMPFVFAGMKVGVTMAMIGVIVGEFITAQAGLGYIIMFASSAGETATVLAAIVLLCVIGLILFGLVALGEAAMQRWYGGEMPVGGVI